MSEEKSVHELAVGMAAFTLLDELLTELENNNIITSQQTWGIIQRAKKNNENQNTSVNFDAAYILSRLR